jgi:hypothetical protein
VLQRGDEPQVGAVDGAAGGRHDAEPTARSADAQPDDEVAQPALDVTA